MKRKTVLIPTVKDVKEFAHFANECDCNVFLEAGSYRVNAKSIMGIFSLDLSAPMTLEVEDEWEAAAFFAKITKFIKS